MAQTNPILGFEAGGPAGLAAIHYEFSKQLNKQWQVGPTLSLGSFKVVDFQNRFNPDFIIPISLQSIYGSQKHRLVTALGLTASNIVYAKETGVQRNWQIAYFGRVAYRFHPSTSSKFAFQISYIPMINDDGYCRHWAGVSVLFKI